MIATDELNEYLEEYLEEKQEVKPKKRRTRQRKNADQSLATASRRKKKDGESND